MSFAARTPSIAYWAGTNRSGRISGIKDTVYMRKSSALTGQVSRNISKNNTSHQNRKHTLKNYT